MDMGRIIKELREVNDLTQEQVAAALGYSHKSSINKIEMGKADLPTSKIKEFADFFKVSPAYLFGLAETDAPADIDLKAALWGDRAELATDAMLDDVKRYAEYIMDKEQQ